MSYLPTAMVNLLAPHPADPAVTGKFISSAFSIRSLKSSVVVEPPAVQAAKANEEVAKANERAAEANQKAAKEQDAKVAEAKKESVKADEKAVAATEKAVAANEKAAKATGKNIAKASEEAAKANEKASEATEKAAEATEKAAVEASDKPPAAVVVADKSGHPVVVTEKAAPATVVVANNSAQSGSAPHTVVVANASAHPATAAAQYGQPSVVQADFRAGPVDATVQLGGTQQEYAQQPQYVQQQQQYAQQPQYAQQQQYAQAPGQPPVVQADFRAGPIDATVQLGGTQQDYARQQRYAQQQQYAQHPQYAQQQQSSPAVVMVSQNSRQQIDPQYITPTPGTTLVVAPGSYTPAQQQAMYQQQRFDQQQPIETVELEDAPEHRHRLFRYVYSTILAIHANLFQCIVWRNLDHRLTHSPQESFFDR